MSSPESLYDSIPYPTFPQPEVHPDRLAAIATLYGVTPPGLDRCRILEIGCGDGRNLLPMAWVMPGAEVVGVDLSASAIERGRALARQIGPTNLDLRQGALENIDDSWGKFDFILAQGVYSWVPSAVRDALLRVCRERLAPNGVALLSFNTLPGGYMRQALRDLIFWDGRGLGDSAQRIAKAQGAVQMVAEDARTDEPVSLAIRSEAHAASHVTGGQLFHDHMATVNDSFYIHQFADHLSRSGLQFLGDATPAEILMRPLPARAQKRIAEQARTRIDREQYVDFLVGRRFRHAIVCHPGVAVAPQLDAAGLDSLWISMPASLENRGALEKSGATARLALEGRTVLETSSTAAKLLLAETAGTWPRRTRGSDLIAAVERRLAGGGAKGGPEVGAELRQFILDGVSRGAMFFHGFKPELIASSGEKPCSFPWVRWEAEQGPLITNGYHQIIRVEDPLLRTLLASMDGSKTRSQLRQELAKAVRGVADVAVAWKRLDTDFDGTLQRLAEAGYLQA